MLWLWLDLFKRQWWAFSPKSLFKQGEQGVWYDPSDLTTMFQKSDGSIPVTAVEQPVGLILDKSKNGVGTNGGARYNLLGYTEDFSNAYWTKQNNNVAITANDALAPNGTMKADKAVFTGVNSLYRTLSFSSSNQSVVFSVYVKGTSGETIGIWVTSTGGGNNTSTQTLNGEWQKFSVELAPSIAISGVDVAIRSSGTATTVWVWGADLRPSFQASLLPAYQPITTDWVATIAGNHAFQITDAKRPVLSARVNMLLSTENFAADSSYWVVDHVGAVVPVVTANYGLSPLGIMNADRVVFNKTGGSYSRLLKAGIPTTSGLSYTFSMWMKNNLAGTANVGLRFDTTGVNCQVTDTWQQFSIQLVASTSSSVQILLYDGIVGNDETADVLVWGADLRPTNTGVNLPPYQRVNTATDYDTAGFPYYLKFDGTDDALVTNSIDFSLGASPLSAELLPTLDMTTAGWTTAGSVTSFTANSITTGGTGGRQLSGLLSPNKYYRVSVTYTKTTGTSAFAVRFNGTDNVVSSNAASGTLTGVGFSGATPGFYLRLAGAETITITAISVKELTDVSLAPDKITVFAGLRKLADTTAVALELTSSVSANTGAFALFSPLSAGNFGFASKATTRQDAIATTYTAPITNIVTGESNLTSSSSKIRVNGAVINENTLSQGYGVLSNAPLYIGSRAGTSLFFNGQLYSLIVRQALTDTSKITKTEKYVNKKTLAY